MKGLKLIATVSFVLSFYPIFAVPGHVKEWLTAGLSFFIFAVALVMIYMQSYKEREKIKSKIFSSIEDKEPLLKEESLKNKLESNE